MLFGARPAADASVRIVLLAGTQEEGRREGEKEGASVHLHVFGREEKGEFDSIREAGAG